MTNSLDVLVLESEPGAAADAIELLQASGHTVHRCHEPGAPAFPCSALTDDGCPLDPGTIDVALTVRPRPRSTPGVLEDGVSCALRHRVPLVVSGSATIQPFGGHTTEVVDAQGDIVGAVQTAAAGSLRKYEAAAHEATREVLVRRGHDDPTINADVHRHQGVIHAAVSVPTAVDNAAREMVAVRVHAAIRKFDKHARQIDIAVN